MSLSAGAGNRISPVRFIVGFGIVSALADVVYEGARSIIGPFLGQLGASAALVGLITGAGEAAALVLRLPAGRLVDRTRRPWAQTITGYALTVLCVPLLAVAGGLPAAQLPETKRLRLDTRLPRRFWQYAAFSATTMLGFSTWAVLAYHLTTRHLLSASLVPVLYAAAMAAAAVTAVGFGRIYDR